MMLKQMLKMALNHKHRSTELRREVGWKAQSKLDKGMMLKQMLKIS